MFKSFILFVFVFCFLFQSFAQSRWELKKDKDSILIYTRSVPNSKFNELKVLFNLKGNYIQLRGMLEDVESYRNWVYSTKESILVEKKAAGDLIYYSEVAAPWPVSNRDFYSHIKIWNDSTSGQLHISTRNVSDNYPVKSRLVRVPYLKADWSISVLSPGWLHIEYTLGWNPGGSIPAWLANMFSTMGPFESFSELRKKMARLNP